MSIWAEIEASDNSEYRWLSNAKRCKECLHLAILHNNHCCQFCKVPGCECREDGQNDTWDDFWEGDEE